MKEVMVIGLGEIGTSVKNIEEKAGNKVYVRDLEPSNCKFNITNEYDVVHVCIPYKEHDFVDTVVENIIHQCISYIQRFLLVQQL